MSLNVRAHHDFVGIPLLPIVQDLGMRGLPIDHDRKALLTEWVTNQIERLDIELMSAGLANPGSAQKLAKDLLALNVPLTKKTKGGNQVATDLEVLQRIHHFYNCVDGQVRYPFLPALMERKKLEKTRANLESLIPCSCDGRVRTSLRSTGTATHRYSSSRLKWCPACFEPFHGTNLQNTAKPDENYPIDCRGACRGHATYADRWKDGAVCNRQHYLRELFVAPPGFEFVEWDYSMLELRILAEVAGVSLLKERLDAFDAGTGPKIHLLNEQDLFGTQKDPNNYTLAKNFVYASVYGGAEVAIQIALAKKGQYLEQAYILELRRKLFAAYPEMVAWQVARQQGFDRARAAKRPLIARNVFGAARLLLASDPAKEGLSTEIQGSAAYIMSFNLLRLRRLHPDTERTLVAQIHDSLLALVPESDVPAVDRTVRGEMERPVWFTDRFTRLPVDGKRGRSWDAMEEFTLEAV